MDPLKKKNRKKTLFNHTVNFYKDRVHHFNFVLFILIIGLLISLSFNIFTLSGLLSEDRLAEKIGELKSEIIDLQIDNDKLFERYVLLNDSKNNLEEENSNLRENIKKLDALVLELKKNNSRILDNMDSSLVELEKTNEELRQSIVRVVDERDDVLDSYEKLGENAARNICCIRKLDDNSIDSFSLEGDMVSCGSELKNDLSCSFD